MAHGLARYDEQCAVGTPVQLAVEDPPEGCASGKPASGYALLPRRGGRLHDLLATAIFGVSNSRNGSRAIFTAVDGKFALLGVYQH
jgi:hypothetical protein